MSNILTLLAIANVVAIAAIAWLVITFLRIASPLDLFLSMTPVLKLLAVSVVILTLIGAGAGLARNLVLVRIVVVLAVASGVVGAIYGEGSPNSAPNLA